LAVFAVRKPKKSENPSAVEGRKEEVKKKIDFLYGRGGGGRDELANAPKSLPFLPIKIGGKIKFM
jgi:hypothetical protein